MVLWSIEDHITSAATDSKSGGSIIKQNSKSGEGNDKTADGPTVGPRGIYCGHEEPFKKNVPMSKMARKCFPNEYMMWNCLSSVDR